MKRARGGWALAGCAGLVAALLAAPRSWFGLATPSMLPRAADAETLATPAISRTGRRISSQLLQPGSLFLRARPAAAAPPAAAPPASVHPSAVVARPGTVVGAGATPGGGAPAAPDVPPPRVAMLATRPGSSQTSLIFQALDTTKADPPVATFSHLPDSSVLGAVVPSTRQVLVIAGTEVRRDPAFGSALLLVSENQQTKSVVDSVYQGTRPLVLDDGRAFVQRGTEGPESTEADVEAGRLRVDHLTIDEIDLEGGTSHTLSAYDGYIAFIAGSLRHEIFVYRVGPDGADIIGVDADTGKERTIIRPLPPFARDFSVDAQAQALLFTNGDPATPGDWVAERLDVTPPPATAPVVSPRSKVAVAARLQLLDRAAHPGLVPTAWVGRTVAVNKNLAGLEVTRAGAKVKVPFASGVDVVREFFFARKSTFALATHHAEGRLPEPVVIDTDTLDAQPIPAPPQTRVDLAGLVEEPTAPVARPMIRRIDVAPAAPIKINPNLFKIYRAPASDEAAPR